MNMLSGIRLPNFDALATKTANCLLGFECETESNVAKGSVNEPSRDKTAAGGKPNTSTDAAINPNQAQAQDNPNQAQDNPNQAQDNKAKNQDNEFVDHAKKVNAEITDALSKMAAENKQQKMNSMSKGPYFLIFIIGLLLMGFSLGDDEKE